MNTWRIACAAMLAVLPCATPAASYHVAAEGDDGNPGTSAAPFRSIQHCAGLASPGDHCIIHPGTYRESVRPARSGTARAPITYRAEAAGTVRLDGRDPAAEWTGVTAQDLAALASQDSHLAQSPFAQAVRDGKVYKATVAMDPAVTEGQVFVGDAMMPEAQFPDPHFDPLEPRIQLARAGSTALGIADPALNQPVGYWKNARAYIQTRWLALTGIVQDSVPGAVALSRQRGGHPGHWKQPCSDITPEATRYYLYGKLSELNAPGEWFHDRASQILYFRPLDGRPPADGAVMVKQRQHGFDLDGRSHIHVTGLGLFGQTIRTGDASRGVILSSLDLRFPSHFVDFRPEPNVPIGAYGRCGSLSGGSASTGIILRGRNNSVRDSRISHSAGNGIALLGSHHTATNNLIHDVNYSGGRGAGIQLAGDHHRVTHNTIYSVGRSAIELSSGVGGRRMRGNRIAYNDLYRYGRLQQDAGAIYTCCGIDFAGGSIDHNRVHDAQGMDKVPFAAELGIYIDGGSSNFLVHSNVGWNNYSGTVGLVANGGINNKVYNNNGNVFVWSLNPATGTEIRNNLGSVLIEHSDRSIAVSDNLPANVDPLYLSPATGDYRLQSGSPARNAARTIPGVTEGSTDRRPSLGAYPYGAPPWQAGASFAPPAPITRQYGVSSLLLADPAWTQPSAALGRRSVEHGFSYMAPRDEDVQGHLRLGFTPPDAQGLAMDRVELRLYARMHRDTPGISANLSLSIDGLGTVWDAAGADFDSTSRAITIDLTSAVAGDWDRLPRWIDLHGTLGPAPFQGHIKGFNATAIWIHAAEIHVQAHDEAGG